MTPEVVHQCRCAWQRATGPLVRAFGLLLLVVHVGSLLVLQKGEDALGGVVSPVLLLLFLIGAAATLAAPADRLVAVHRAVAVGVPMLHIGLDLWPTTSLGFFRFTLTFPIAWNTFLSAFTTPSCAEFVVARTAPVACALLACPLRKDLAPHQAAILWTALLLAPAANAAAHAKRRRGLYAPPAAKAKAKAKSAADAKDDADAAADEDTAARTAAATWAFGFCGTALVAVLVTVTMLLQPNYPRQAVGGFPTALRAVWTKTVWTNFQPVDNPNTLRRRLFDTVCYSGGLRFICKHLTFILCVVRRGSLRGRARVFTMLCIAAAGAWRAASDDARNRRPATPEAEARQQVAIAHLRLFLKIMAVPLALLVAMTDDFKLRAFRVVQATGPFFFFAIAGKDYRKVVTPDLVAPISTLRTWAFTFCFLSIGLTTRLRSLAATGWRPLLAFTAGVVVNVIIGYVLSVHVFADYWNGLGG